MEKEDKELLLKDLCARLPYGVNVEIEFSKENGSSLRGEICSEGMLTLNTDLLGLFQEEEIYLKAYLRPLLSMTEEEKKDYDKLFTIHSDGDTYCENWEWSDFMNSHHFDYRGLIEKGFALAAPEGMYGF